MHAATSEESSKTINEKRKKEALGGSSGSALTRGRNVEQTPKERLGEAWLPEGLRPTKSFFDTSETYGFKKTKVDLAPPPRVQPERGDLTI